MAEIEDLVARVEGLPITDDTLTLTAAALATPATTAFFARVVQGGELRFDHARCSRGDGWITVTGTTSLPGFKGVAGTLTFSTDENGLVCSIQGLLPGEVGLPLVTWVKLRRAGFTTTLLQPYDIVESSFLADIAVSETNPAVIPIRIADIGSGLWQFETVDALAHTVSLTEILGLLRLDALGNLLPDTLQAVLAGLVLSDFAAEIDLGAKRINDFSVGLSATNGWSGILPGVDLAPGLDLLLSVGDPAAESRRLTGVVRGTLLVGSTRVPVFTQAVVSAQPTNWMIGLDPDPSKYDPEVGGVAFPTLEELVALASSSAARALPAGLKDVPGLVVTRFMVRFDTNPARLDTLVFAARTASPWTLVDGFLTIQNLSMELDVAGPSAATAPQIGGWVAGSLRVADAAYIFLRVAKDVGSSDWTLAGGLVPGQTFSLTDILNGLLHDRVGWSDMAPPIVFDSATMQATPGRSASLTAGSNNTPWVLASGLSVDRFLLSFRYTAALAPAKATFEGSLSARISVGSVAIDIRTALDRSGDLRFTGSATVTDGHAIRISDVARTLGWKDMPTLPESLDVELESLAFGYDHAKGFAVFTAEAKGLQLTLMSGDTSASPASRYYVVGLDLTIAADLTSLPLVGGDLPSNSTLAIDNLHLLVASQALAAEDVGAANVLVAALTGIAAPRPLPAAPLRAGFNLALDRLALDIGSLHVTAAPGAGGGGTAAGTGGAPALPAAVSQGGAAVQEAKAGAPMQSNMRWYEIQRQLGPVDLERIGVEVGSGGYTFALGAALAIGPVGFSLEGLSISSPFDPFSPSFDLSGLGASVRQPPLEILGGLLKVPQSPTSDIAFQYDGVLVVEAEQFGLAAVGSYAQYKSGAPSLFAFAQLLAPLGGPAAFFVTGLMGGFGFNRALTLPGQDQVMSFPLLALAAPPVPPATMPPAADVLTMLESGPTPTGGGTAVPWIRPERGQYWLAAGVLFTSFEILSSQVLAVVEFGRDLEIALLGLSTLQLPLPAESAMTCVFVEMQIRLVVLPEDGVFAASAMLAPTSYVFTPDCHLTGGFAFNMWFGSNDHAGDLVATLGGYHPAFKVPSHYPQVPRLGFNWKPSDSVAIHGEAYFALTPSCVMAGGALIVLYRDGDTSAWFTAHADFLIGWRPFSYTAEIAVSIGVSYRLDLLFCSVSVSASVSAAVELWGPPTGGVARVDLSVISFSVAFGASQAALNEAPLAWGAFKSLLPAESDICRTSITGGLFRTLPEAAGGASSGVPSRGGTWVVRAHRLSFSTRSAIPASHLDLNGTDATPSEASGISIKPMNLAGVPSRHSVEIAGPALDLTRWVVTPVTGRVPAKLWGSATSHSFMQTPAAPSADLVEGALLGYDIAIPGPQLSPGVGPISRQALGDGLIARGRLPVRPDAQPMDAFVGRIAPDVVKAIGGIASPEVAGMRAALVAELQSAGAYAGANDDMAPFASRHDHLFSASPMICQ